jgi:hypothetical protein
MEHLLSELRASGCFEAAPGRDWEPQRARAVTAARRAFGRLDWELTEDGELHPGHGVVITSQGRPAIEEQLQRIRRAIGDGDPALLLGTAKEMLESTGKYVLEQFGQDYSEAIDFNQLWYLARERLGIHPSLIDTTQPGGQQVKKIVGAAWTIAEQANELRKEEGTGHGRTLPSQMSPEMARLVVREACNVVDFVLRTLDRQFGR